MQYLGGKHTLAKHIVPHIQQALLNRSVYVEPFCGACNVVAKVQTKTRVASDVHPHLIALLQAAQQGWEPPKLAISAEEYQEVKNNQDQYDPAWVGLVGFGASFGAKWFGGYARYPGTDFLGGSWRSLQRKMRTLRNVHFCVASYTEYSGLEDAVIYCDPPYAGTTGYKDTSAFDHIAFWDWCKQMAQHNTVLVSEFTVPEDTDLLWSKQRKTIVRRDGQVPIREYLVRVRP